MSIIISILIVTLDLVVACGADSMPVQGRNFARRQASIMVLSQLAQRSYGKNQLSYEELVSYECRFGGSREQNKLNVGSTAALLNDAPDPSQWTSYIVDLFSKT